MAHRFFDTSAAAKHYRAETGTAVVDAFLAEAGSRHLLSDLSLVELHSVLARLVRTGIISLADLRLARGCILADVTSGLWTVVPLTPAHFHHAQQLLVLHGLVRGFYTLDALQLSVALGQHAATPLDAFVCADANLSAIATAEGLTVVNP